MDAIITTPNKRPAMVNEFVILIAITAEMLAVEKENTAFVRFPSSPDRSVKPPFNINQTFLQLYIQREGQRKVGVSKNQQLTPIHKRFKECLYVNATNNQGGAHSTKERQASEQRQHHSQVYPSPRARGNAQASMQQSTNQMCQCRTNR
mmetsp:Transcript_8523/g.13287  ORF Transcript_8523/g.13287 Transcript_8523/m.13287 type:complete len:149 (+) Transcript_8523:200-646(+)